MEILNKDRIPVLFLNIYQNKIIFFNTRGFFVICRILHTLTFTLNVLFINEAFAGDFTCEKQTASFHSKLEVSNTTIC